MGASLRNTTVPGRGRILMKSSLVAGTAGPAELKDGLDEFGSE